MQHIEMKMKEHIWHEKKKQPPGKKGNFENKNVSYIHVKSLANSLLIKIKPKNR